MLFEKNAWLSFHVVFYARRQLRRNNNKSIAITECVTAKTALKEWSKTEKAIERGEQVLLFRKGGINDNNNRWVSDFGESVCHIPDVVSFCQ
jgi:hypothetical protein